MSEWCLAHPWLTFFIAMNLAGSIAGLVRIVVVRNRP